MLLIAIYQRRVTVYQAVRELLTAIVGGLLSLENTLYPDNSFVSVSKAQGINVSFPVLPMSISVSLCPRPQGWLSSWLPAWRPTSMSQLKNVEAKILQCLQNKFLARVKHLILVDPWGFPLRPTDPSEIRAPPTWVKAVASVLGRSNPLAVLRIAGPWGPGLVQRFRPDFKRKFADFFEDDTISEYIYHCNAQNPSGETAFKAMMESFGWARRPMIERIHLIRKDVPITMIYGSNTWIDTSTGKKVKLQRPDSYVRDMEIEGASHHVYADQPHIFNAVVEEICDSVD
ncbi:PREDICTED: abhydrolase domain-containing protein 4 isoform X4 [Myotis brandtii]|uniref:abhydrolase domain-containing protein 4 isoform X4 n=1 Tax=Myotis brandtii TaxID=109478 RepID=UPI0007042F29|nr:PREDICTED: abhydrolase domain-containing protein 4 isoform X4 [Myotis brandtii]